MLRFASFLLITTIVYCSPPMCHCPNGQVGLQCPTPITFNCPPSPPCPSSPPCNMFAALPTLPTFATFAPFAVTQSPQQLPPAISPPVNGQEALVGINQPPTAQIREPYAPQQPPPPPPPPAPQAPPVQQYVEAGTEPPLVIQDSTTIRPSTLPSEKYVELENPEDCQPPPPVLHNVVDHVFESEPNNGYRQPVRRQAVSEKCNDDRLKRIIEDNVDENPSTSKRKIQKAAAEEIGGLFDVICSAHDFSYLANTQLFCEAGNDDVTCFAFLHSLIQ
ncbi:unnamed protein product [Caenorhabditis bovis]|uniref:Ground-like domain-containing protein n=1 Tax=Caenorhabditis bovis TaxID=2654633 RepID=A0A8S1EBM9_9PELO|nr:unnamed protein product [Caenorhabditis bovis]